MTLADYIKTQLDTRKMTLHRLSKLTGISYGYLDRIEKDIKKNPSYEVLKKISVAFNVDVLELLSAAGYESTQKSVGEASGTAIPVYHLSEYLVSREVAIVESVVWGDRGIHVGLQVDQVIDGYLHGDILLMSTVTKVVADTVVLLRWRDKIMAGRVVKARSGMVVVPLGGVESTEVDRDQLADVVIGRVVALVRRY